jgi:flagellar hook assembly protein FlgD
LAPGVQRTSRKSLNESRLLRSARVALSVFVAATFAITAQLAPASPAISAVDADTPTPKAVIIVGPTGGLTDNNLVDAEKMAVKAENAGMDVRRVFFPHATWEKVLANIQGANVVVYMGHGYGWPSPYTTKLTESRQDGFGLNSWDGSGPNEYKYYGANPIRQYVDLAPNAVVILVHGCYTAGNGEPGMPIPSEDLARERVDNFASGFLGAGARAVFAFGSNQKLNYMNALASSNMTMDQIFMSPADGSLAGFVGWNDRRFDSVRTPGATNHLDPHSKHGYYRAVSGWLNMTAADWRTGADVIAPPPPPPPPPPSDPADPPQITALTAGTTVGGNFVSGPDVPSFHPNGDGLEEELVVEHTVSRAAYLDATVTDSAGQPVRSYSNWSTTGTSTSRWDGKNNAGQIVADGAYTLTYVPRDLSGITGDPVSTNALVLTAAAVPPPSKLSIYVSDADKIDKNTTLSMKLNQPAQVTWSIKNLDGLTVRTINSGAQMAAGLTSFVWDGKSDAGTWVPDGRYRSVVNAQTGLGSYSQERQIYVGAFQFAASSSSVTRGVKATLDLISTEFLSSNPSVRITQPGQTAWTVTAKLVSGHKYKLTFTPKTGGDAGMVTFVINGTDSKGHKNSGSLSLPLN